MKRARKVAKGEKEEQEEEEEEEEEEGEGERKIQKNKQTRWMQWMTIPNRGYTYKYCLKLLKLLEMFELRLGFDQIERNGWRRESPARSLK